MKENVLCFLLLVLRQCHVYIQKVLFYGKNIEWKERYPFHLSIPRFHKNAR